MRELLRGAFVIGRRDFSATVLSKTFLFFLLGPLFPLLFGVTFGGIVGGAAAQRETPTVAVIASQAEFDRLEAARERLAGALGQDQLLALVRLVPEPDVAAQEKELLDARDAPRAVLTGLPDHPRLTGTIEVDGTVAGQVRLFLAGASV
ncbi:MAG TPA: ABC transporter permease, partial [Sphingomicrobium sp.]